LLILLIILGIFLVVNRQELPKAMRFRFRVYGSGFPAAADEAVGKLEPVEQT